MKDIDCINTLLFLFSYRYIDNRVFVSLANGELIIYSRDQGKSFQNPFSPITSLNINLIKFDVNENG